MCLEDQKNRTCIGSHLGRPRPAERRVISVVKIGYVRRSEFSEVLSSSFASRAFLPLSLLQELRFEPLYSSIYQICVKSKFGGDPH
jgi:hypothetical protein